MPIGPVFGGGRGGGGALVVATRSDNNNPAVFADVSARDAYTATPEGAADAARINVDNQDRAREVFAVGALDASNNVTSITAAYIRLNNSWVSVATNLVGTPGADGAPGSETDFSGVGTGNIPVPGASPDFTPVDSGLRAGSEILYFGDTTAENTMRLRRDNTNGYLHFERLESGSWNEKLLVSDSVSVDIVNLIETTQAFTVASGEIAFYSQQIRDDQGANILRQFFTDGTNTFPALASLPSGDVRVIQNLADVLANPDTVNASYKTVTFDQDLSTVAKSGSYNDLSNTPSIPPARTDEEIRDVMGATLVAGENVSITVNDAANTITISASGGAGPTPTPVATDLRYGLSDESDPTLVVFAGLTDVASPTDPQTVSTGVTSAGQYFHILTSNTHEIVRITDTVLSQDVYVRGGTGNVFTLVSDARTESGITYDALTLGPLNAGVDEEYVVRFS